MGALPLNPGSSMISGMGTARTIFSISARTGWLVRSVAFMYPKGSSQAQLVQGKANLVQLRQEIPLNDSELNAVDDGVAAMEKLLEQLVDVPTPAGPTPRELGIAGATVGAEREMR